MMEKRVLFAAMLSAVFLAWYSQFVARSIRKPTATQQAKLAATSNGSNPTATPVPEQPYLIENEDVIALESSSLLLEVGRASGAVRRVTLKQFKQSEGAGPLQLGDGKVPVIALSVHGKPISLKDAKATQDGREMRGAADEKDYHINYALDNSKPILHIVIDSELPANEFEELHPAIFMAWGKADHLSGRYNTLETIVLRADKSGKKTYKRNSGFWKTAKIVPRGTTILSLSERYFCLSLRPQTELLVVRILPPTPEHIMAEAKLQSGPAGDKSSFGANIYLGPRDFFDVEKTEFEPAFPVGAFGQIGLILLLILKWLVGITRNYGLGIILLSGLVTCVTAPFSLMSMRSMKKMQELKPQADRVMAQHKDDPAKAQKELFALYREHRVSPLGGCLPMLLQFPVFIALFQAISHFVELRGKSFLWITDLSLPDRLAKLPLSFPIIGSDLNALPIVMAVAMYAQTRLSQRAMPKDQSSQAANAMMSAPVMSILFGVMFYNFPSGLVLYWLTNSLSAILLYRLAS